jgi:hypothetical protein
MAILIVTTNKDAISLPDDCIDFDNEGYLKLFRIYHVTGPILAPLTESGMLIEEMILPVNSVLYIITI